MENKVLTDFKNLFVVKKDCGDFYMVDVYSLDFDLLNADVIYSDLSKMSEPRIRYLKQGIKKRIHVNQHNIKHNIKDDNLKPVITCKTSKENLKGDGVKIMGESLVEYKPEKPLSCGAKVWIITKSPVFVF